jgi:nicotinate-nucleotide adenylyltransferase
LHRLGIFGGSFDPVHLGHALVAQAALEELQLERLFIVPAARSPFKPDFMPAPPASRLQLLRLAFAGQSQIEIDELELERGGVSYTVETLRHYHARFDGAQLFYLMGADHLQQLPHWHEASELARLATFVVIPRPGEVAGSFPPPFSGIVLQGFPLAVSSSQIRRRIQEGKPIDYLVPALVAEALRNSRLYF